MASDNATEEKSWPERPTCHDKDPSPFARSHDHAWHVRDDGLRHCNYCGSLHPEDLIAAIDKGATLTGSDWKYGWPHKFYVTIPLATPEPIYSVANYQTGPNAEPNPGEPGTWRERVGTSSVTTAKWYNAHLLDDGYSEAARAELFAALKEHTDIEWVIDPVRGLGYIAPYPGYQKY